MNYDGFDEHYEYKSYIICGFTITKLQVGDKEFDGWTTYTIKTKNNVWLADYIEDSGEPHIMKFDTLDKAKEYIDNKVNAMEILCNVINSTCLFDSGYNEILLKDLVVAYTLYKDIFVDTYAWDILIDYLWNNLNTNFLVESFDNKEHFDNYMAMDLV